MRTPLVLAANCFLALKPPATFDPDFFRNRKSGAAYSGPERLRVVRKLARQLEKERPGVIEPVVNDMITELDTIFVKWLRDAVAHCYYLLDLKQSKVYTKGQAQTKTFDQVSELYQRAIGYLDGFRTAVDGFGLESSGLTYKPDWGTNY